MPPKSSERRNGVAFSCVSLLSHPQCVQLDLESAPIDYFGRAKFISHDVFHRSLRYSQLSSLISFGQGAPLPVSRSDLRLSRKTAHLVLQWCMNSTGSFQPWCLKRTTVQSPFCLTSKLIFVPSHSSGPSTTCHRTRLPRCSSRTFMSKPPSPKRNCNTPPTLLSPRVSLVHQREGPSMVANAV